MSPSMRTTLLCACSLLAIAAALPATNSQCVKLLNEAQSDSLLCRQVPNPPAPGFCKIVVPEIMGCCSTNSSWQQIEPGFVNEPWAQLHDACATAEIQAVFEPPPACNSTCEAACCAFDPPSDVCVTACGCNPPCPKPAEAPLETKVTEEVIHCEWSDSSAPFFITFDNQAPEDIKIRSCPKKYTTCTGDETQPNHYIDCGTELPGSKVSNVLVNNGVGYLVLYYKASGSEFQLNPTVPGGSAWDGRVTIPPAKA